jgi:arylsulfatase A-like enzyme
MLRRLLDSPYTYFTLAALIVVGWFASRFELRPPPRKTHPISHLETLRGRDDLNVVFLVIDTLRADRLTCYGYGRDTTPVMDTLAAHGVRFANNVAQSSWTKASMASLWMGMYPTRNGIIRYPHGIPSETRMPAEVLRDAGFYTAGLYRNGWIEPNFGFGQGFDAYFMPRPNESPQEYKRRQLSYQVAGSDFDVTQAAQEFLENYKHRRFFLYLHYMDLHQYTFGTNFAKYGTSYSDYYDNALAWTDANIGMLVQRLIDLDLLDETLIVVAADHGEEFQEHGQEGHAKSLYREVVMTPLIFSLPFNVEGGGLTVDALTANVDIWPTILDILGLEPMAGAQGRSLVPVMLGKETLEGRAVFSELDGQWGSVNVEGRPWVAATTDDWRFIRFLPDETRNELYDRKADPGEEKNLIAEKPEVAAELRALTEELMADEGAVPEPTVQEIDDLRLNQLRALGYAIEKK